jgi:hypothetical protein
MNHSRISSPSGRVDYGYLALTDDQQEAIANNCDRETGAFRAGDVLTPEQRRDLGIRADAMVVAE